MRDETVILLEGARAVGKSTLLREFASAHGAAVIDLDDLATKDAATIDPATFVAGSAPVCVDEYQKAPPLLDAIKAELNRDSSPGRFLITGSTRHDALPMAAQALTGRMHRITVHPLSQGEISGVREHLLSDLFDDPTAAVDQPPSTTTRDHYIERIVAGGFPMALIRTSESARNRWFDDYVRLTMDRDIRELRQVRQGAAAQGRPLQPSPARPVQPAPAPPAH